MKKAIFLDVDNCMYDGFNSDGSYSRYGVHARAATNAWAESVTGKTAQELKEYRAKHGHIVGHDQALLDFLKHHTGKHFGVQDLAQHRGGPLGYHPETFLESNDKLVSCLVKVADAGFLLVIISDNPVAKRTIRQLGIDDKLIPDKMIYDAVRMGKFKDSDFLKNVLDDLGVEPKNAAMFGDSERSDIAPARAVGMQTYLCLGPNELIKAIEKHIGNAR